MRPKSMGKKERKVKSPMTRRKSPMERSKRRALTGMILNHLELMKSDVIAPNPSLNLSSLDDTPGIVLARLRHSVESRLTR
jgi:hypothetical protein